MLGQFQTLADEYLASALAGRHHGFSNVRDTLQEIHKGMSKAYPCGAGLGLMGVATDGDVALCHRFAGSDEHKLGAVRGGVNREMQQTFLDKHHIDDKTDCATAGRGRSAPAAAITRRTRATARRIEPNLHYCDWIRGVDGHVSRRSTVSWRRRSPSSCASSIDEMPEEVS